MKRAWAAAVVQAVPILSVTGAKVLGGISLIALNLWIAHQMPPASYGSFALAATALMLLDGMVGSGLDAAVIGSSQEAPSAPLTDSERAGVLLKLAAGVVACVVVPGALAATAGTRAAQIGLAACLGGTGFLLHRSALTYLQIRHRYAGYGAVDLAHTLGRWLAVWLLFRAGHVSPLAAIGAYAGAAWAVALIALAVIPGRGIGSATIHTPAFRTVCRAALTAVATTGVGALVARLDLLVLGVVGSPAETGILAAAATIALAPTWLGAYLAPAFTSRILPYSQAGILQPFFRRVQAALLVLAVAGALLGALLAPLLVAHLLPPQYAAAAAPVVPVLLAAGAAGFFTFPLVLHTLLFLSPRTYLAMDLISLPVLVALYLIAGRRGGALGVASVTAGAAIIKAYIAHTAASSAVVRAADGAGRVAALSPAQV